MGLSYFIFIVLFNYKMVISNIRCPIGDSIFVLTLYFDLLSEKRRKKYLLGYLICCGIHPIFFLFVLIRFLFILKNRITDKLFYILILLYSLFINVFLEFLGNIMNIELFRYMSMKLDFYKNSWNIKSNEPLIIITGIIQIIILIILLLKIKKRIDKNSSEEKFFKINVAYIILAISSAWNFVAFQRCTWLLVFFIVIWYMYGKSFECKKSKFSITIYDIVIYMLVIFSFVSYFFTYQYNVLTF